MEGKIVSLQNSKDFIEQLYGQDILRHFPNYERFWIEFIGNPNADQVEPYTYSFPNDIVPEEQHRIEKGYEKVQIAHYTLFCHLAGAHFQEKELENARKIENPKERYFLYCEHFEVAYMHLGSTFYVLDTLWNTVLRMTGHRDGGGRFGKIKNYLNQKRESELIVRLDKVTKSVMIRRHLPVHFGRVFVKWHKGELYVPLEVSEDMIWSQGTETVEWRKGDNQLHFDIVETEKMINSLHEVLISEYMSFVNSKNIRIEKGG